MAKGRARRLPGTLGSMSHVRRDAIFIAAAIAVAWLVTPWLHIGWFLVAVPKSYSTTIAWLDFGFLSLWVFELIWGALFGVVLARGLRSRGAMWWSLVLGVVLGLSQFVPSRHRFAPDVSPSVYIWAYGQYVMPIIGALAACWLVEKHWPRGHRSGPSAA